MRAVNRLVRDALVSVAIALLLLAAAEAALRLASRILSGQWPETRTAALYRTMRAAKSLYRRDPFLMVAPRAGAHAVVSGKEIRFNSLGYRSPERPLAKRTGVIRIVCSGGSSTLDLLARDDQATWPWRLEDELRPANSAVEVWNAGFNGWTSLENLISLANRDVDLAPDIVVLFQGINDLQPAAHQPFDPHYVAGHAAVCLRALGYDLPPLRWWQRSVLIEGARDLLGRRGDAAELLLPTRQAAPVRADIPAEAVATFARNVRSFIAVAREHGARVVLVTQTIRVRRAHRVDDLSYLAGWLPGLDPAVAASQLQRFNDVLRHLGGGQQALLADAAAVCWSDEDFADPMHFSAQGSVKFATYLAGQLWPVLAPLTAEGSVGSLKP